VLLAAGLALVGCSHSAALLLTLPLAWSHDLPRGVATVNGCSHVMIAEHSGAFTSALFACYPCIRMR